jgi:hypothetical protein
MDTLNSTLQKTSPAGDVSDDELERLGQRPLSEREWVDVHLDTLIEVHARLKRHCEFFALGLLEHCSFVDFCTFCYNHSVRGH